MPLLAIFGFVLVSCLFPVGVSYLVDRHLHEGVDFFKRRRVLRHGVEASAKVLSRSVKGVEIMYLLETKANELREGATVPVKYDPSDKTVVLVRLDANQLVRDR